MSAAARAARAKRRPLTLEESGRQLRRATLGVRIDHIEAAEGMRLDQWVDSQLDMAYTPNQMLDVCTNYRFPGFPDGPVVPGGWPAANSFLNWKFQQPEKLRTRLTYALTEYFSMGNLVAFGGFNNPHAVFWDILEQQVHEGTFRTLIEAVTRSQPMSRWLTYWRNAKTDGTRQPDENYAREVMQLYTIGLDMLRPDGTRILRSELDPSDPRYAATGEAATQPAPTYGQSDIANMARVFTGLTACETWDNGATINTPDEAWNGWGGDIGTENLMDAQGRRAYAARLVYAPSFHESSLPKVALQGRVNIPIGTAGDASLTAALDALVAHPSCAPYFCRRMIQLLTTSNPSPAYIGRMSAVFRATGGNLRAVFRAILLDQEVMAPADKGLTTRVPSYEEQCLALVLSGPPGLSFYGSPSEHIGGADYPGNPELEGEEAEPSLIGMDWQGPLQCFNNPSVFGRWPARYSAAGDVFNAGLVSPELATLTESNVTDLLNSGNLFEHVANTSTQQDRDDCRTTGDRVGLVNRVSFLLTGGTAPDWYIAQILSWLENQRQLSFDTETGAAETYRSLVAAFWLSPWGISRS